MSMFVCDARRLCEWSRGKATGNDFEAGSGDRGAKGRLSEKAATGTIGLPGGKAARYVAGRATAAAGVYELEVAPDGELSGASAAGVGVTGDSTLPEPGSGAGSSWRTASGSGSPCPRAPSTTACGSGPARRG